MRILTLSDVFLSLAYPQIGIINRENYLRSLGWELVNNGNGWQLHRRFIPALTLSKSNSLFVMEMATSPPRFRSTTW